MIKNPAKGSQNKVEGEVLNNISRGDNKNLLAGFIVAAPLFVSEILRQGELKMILEKSRWPYDLQREEVKGVFVGGCIDRGEGSRFRAKAHAHTEEPNKGWLCFLSIKRINEPMLVKHELAHLLTGQGHTDKWRTKVLQLGGTLDQCNSVIDGGILLRSYQKVSRSKTEGN